MSDIVESKIHLNENWQKVVENQEGPFSVQLRRAFNRQYIFGASFDQDENVLVVRMRDPGIPVSLGHADIVNIHEGQPAIPSR